MSENYKIKVNDEAESKEAQELFKQLGCKLVECHRVGMVAVNDGEIYPDVIGNWDEYCGKELTLPQLRDLVVLHRNDVKDATHDGTIHKYYKAESTWYYFDAPCKRWFESTGGKQEFYNKLTPIQSEPEQGLISGADALRALADGKEVEHKANSHMPWGDASLIAAKLFSNTGYQFRLKPRTITLSLEIPAPFEPKDGDSYWFLNSASSIGYSKSTYSNGVIDENNTQFGAWDSEEKIKQVVVALKQIKSI